MKPIIIFSILGLKHIWQGFILFLLQIVKGLLKVKKEVVSTFLKGMCVRENSVSYMKI